jgi:hypothetical protein
MSHEPCTNVQIEIQPSFLGTRLVDFGFDFGSAAFFEEAFDLALVLVDIGSDAALILDFVLDFALDLVEAEEDLGFEEIRVVFLAPDLTLAFAEVFEMDILRDDLLADASGIEPCGGCSLFAIKGISSDLNSCGEGALPLLRHLAGLSAQAST